jgi:ferritin
MFNKSVEKAINEQINKEFSSAYLYLSMAAHFEGKNLSGFANWMKVQYQEETAHAMKLFGYVYDRGGTVTLKAIDQPPVKFNTPLEIFGQVLEHEKKVTDSINKLYELALKEKDYPTQSLLQWYINEQVEEEKNDSSIIQTLELTGNSPISILMLDRQLAARKAG